MEKAAIYCRLSEEDRGKLHASDDSASIQNQKTMLAQYAMERGWEVYRIYSDDDYAGADRSRPAFQKLLADAEAHRFDIILCKTQSRFTRELELVEKYIHGLFPLWGIRFVSIVDNADTANKGNKKSRQINGLVNEWYLEDMSENIRSVLTSRRQNGFHIGAFAPYGYRKDPEQKGRLIPDPEAASVVREVFTLFSQGHGKSAIARMLNDRGIPNPAEYKRLHGLNYRSPKSKSGTLWRYNTISSMLANEMYLGNLVQGRYGSVSYKTKQNRPRPKEQWYIVQGTHEAIVDRALWDQVQALRMQRAKPFQTGAIGLFAGKARCMYCGSAMRSTKSKGRRYLKCACRSFSRDACTGAFISVDRLERMVLEELNRLARLYLDKEKLKKRISIPDTRRRQKECVQESLSRHQKKRQEYTAALRALYLDKVRGVVTEQDFAALSQSFAEDKRRLEERIAEDEAQMAALEKRAADGEGRRMPVEQYTHLEHLTREMVELLMDSIAVGRRIPGTKDVPIEIHWKF